MRATHGGRRRTMERREKEGKERTDFSPCDEEIFSSLLSISTAWNSIVCQKEILSVLHRKCPLGVPLTLPPPPAPSFFLSLDSAWVPEEPTWRTPTTTTTITRGYWVICCSSHSEPRRQQQWQQQRSGIGSRSLVWWDALPCGCCSILQPIQSPSRQRLGRPSLLIAAGQLPDWSEAGPEELRRRMMWWKKKTGS